jgi:hypothetical protein
MKQFWHKLASKLWDSVLSIACLHKMGMSPVETDTFLGIVDSGNEEACYIVGAARLKSMDEMARIEHG